MIFTIWFTRRKRVLITISPCLSFSLSLRLFLWSTEALWVHFHAWAPKTFSRRCSAPSLHRRAPEASVNRASPVPGALLAFRVNQGISASFSLLYFLIGWLWITRFWSITGPQQDPTQPNKFFKSVYLVMIIHKERKMKVQGVDEKSDMA